MQFNTSFSIEHQISPTTNKPFGSKYAGTFSVRRPTLQDKTMTVLRYTAMISTEGGTGVHMIADALLDINYAFAQLSVIKTADLPSWFDRDKIYEEDEAAVQAVTKLVSDFINSFRNQNSGGESQPTSQDAAVVV
jgi:hypothetical protein